MPHDHSTCSGTSWKSTLPFELAAFSTYLHLAEHTENVPNDAPALDLKGLMLVKREHQIVRMVSNITLIKALRGDTHVLFRRLAL